MTGVYLTLHKREILGKISSGISHINVKEWSREMTENSDNLEHQALFDNIEHVHVLNQSVSNYHTWSSAHIFSTY